MKKEKSVFEVLSAVNVSDKVEKKGNLSYLSWAWAWGEVKKRYPSAKYWYYKDKKTKLPLAFNNAFGGFCYTRVTIDGDTLPMWLPILDNRNQTVTKPNAFQVNSTLMRCLTKNLAMHGLGHYIYAGEDLPASADIQELSKTDEKPWLKKSELEATLKGTKKQAETVLAAYNMKNEYKQQIINKFKI
jgi:hypothetical protein